MKRQSEAQHPVRSGRSKAREWSTWGLVVLGAGLAALGCANIESIAPPIDPAATNARNLESGRQIYVSRCSRCHSPVATDKHTSTEWRSIVGKMGPRSHLTAQEERSLLLYLQSHAADE